MGNDRVGRVDLLRIRDKLKCIVSHQIVYGLLHRPAINVERDFLAPSCHIIHKTVASANTEIFSSLGAIMSLGYSWAFFPRDTSNFVLLFFCTANKNFSFFFLFYLNLISKNQRYITEI